MSVPDWERKCGFDPTKVAIRGEPAWVTLNDGRVPSSTFPVAEDVLENYADLIWTRCPCEILITLFVAKYMVVC